MANPIRLENNGLRIPRPRHFVPEKIIHKFITVISKSTQLEKPGPLEWKASDVPNTHNPLDISGYMASIVRDDRPPPEPLVLTTPFDIPVYRPSYVVLQLDKAVNWQFLEGSTGVGTKEKYEHLHENYRYGDNFGTTFVRRIDGNVVTSTGTAPDGCRYLYFGVAYRYPRDPDKPDYLMQQFNVIVDFLQDGHHLPTIFDPDVGNNGGSVFPP